MTCTQTEKVSQLIDGELNSAEALPVKRHLLDCAECHEAHESFLLLRGQLTSYQGTVAQTDVDTALADVLSRGGVSDKARFEPSWRDRLVAAFSVGGAFNPRFAAAALIILAVGIGIVMVLMPRRGQELAVNTQQGTSEAVVDKNVDKPQTPKPGSSSQTTAPPSKAPKPSQTPARNNSRPPRRNGQTPPNYSTIENNVASGLKPLDQVEVELMTARHLEQSEVLLRAFRNVRSAQVGHSPDVRYERQRAQKLIYQNMLVRREADAKGDVQVATLLGNLEPILLDIANLRDKPAAEDVADIKRRVERQNLVPLLQISSAAVARAYD